MKISVCMATYNGEKYIEEQLRSILLQLSDKDEVIVSDDSSTDNTILIIQQFNDRRIKLYPNQKFHNPALNFENALNKSSGDIIFLADQDDIWDKAKVVKMMSYLSNYDLVISDCSIIDEYGNELHKSFFNIRGSKKGIIRNLYKNSYIGCCIAFRRRVFSKILPFPQGIYMHDWWIGMIAEFYGDVYFCPEKLVSYRRHQNNASPTSDFRGYSFSTKLYNRINLFKHLLTRLVFFK
jgi:glycosyltransferase involved in cell wall biosynthesis